MLRVAFFLRGPSALHVAPFALFLLFCWSPCLWLRLRVRVEEHVICNGESRMYQLNGANELPNISVLLLGARQYILILKEEIKSVIIAVVSKADLSTDGV